MATALTVVFLVLLLITTATRVWLGHRHVAHIQAHRTQVPEAFSETISLQAHQKAADYSAAKTRLMIQECC